MTPNSVPVPSSVVILKAGRLLGSVLGQVVRQLFPEATVHLANTLSAGRAVLATQPADLLLVGIDFPDGDSLDLIGQWGERQPVLVVTSHWEQRLLAALRVLPIRGIFDPSSEEIEDLEAAVRLVGRGEHYWSLSVLDRFYAMSVPSSAISRMLSPTEHLIFAVIGDGSDDRSAAGQLNLRPSTIQSVRRELHRKLGIQHRGDLVRLAVQHGYVRFTAGGVQRPGFSRLLAACQKPCGFRPAREAMANT